MQVISQSSAMRPLLSRAHNPLGTMQMPRQRWPLLVALIASILLHLLLLITTHADALLEPVYAGGTLTVTLQTRRAATPDHNNEIITSHDTPPPKASEKTAPARKTAQALATAAPLVAINSATPQPAPTDEHRDTATVNHSAQEQHQLHDETSTPISVSRINVETSRHTATRLTAEEIPPAETASTVQHLQTSLGNHFARSFRYPRLAQHRGWQGKVTVGLRVEADGQLSRIHLLHTSGHSLLDNDAINTLRRIAYLPEARGWLQGNHLDMVLPVEYRLLGS